MPSQNENGKTKQTKMFLYSMRGCKGFHPYFGPFNIDVHLVIALLPVCIFTPCFVQLYLQI